MSFVQVMEITADDIDLVRNLGDQWKTATTGKRTARRQIITRDRNDPDHYRIVVFFDSYESAMANSQLPETQELAGKMRSVVKDVAFFDLDVILDEQL